MRYFRYFVLFVFLLGMAVAANAQEDACPAIVQTALSTVETLCAETGRNQACYGNLALVAQARDGVTDFQFSQPGDITDLAAIQALTLDPLDTVTETWGVALLRAQANLPDTLPGQNVTLLLFGDVEISNQGGVSDESGSYGDMQAFYFRTGIADAPCSAAPESGILVQTPQGAERITLQINDAVVTLGSTAFLQAVPGDAMLVSVLEGMGEVTAGGASVAVPAGTRVSVPLDSDGRAGGVPSYPAAYTTDQADALPVVTLPEVVEAAEPISAEEAPLHFTGPSTTLNTDPAGRVLFPRPSGDFIAETKVTFSPDSNFQGAGIYADFDTGGHIELVLAYCAEGEGGGTCVGRGLYFDAFGSPGFSAILAHVVTPYSGTVAYLQIENTAGTYTARYRTSPGAAWTDFASFDASPVVTAVGIMAQSASSTMENPFGAPAIPAVFEDFILRRP